MKLSDTTLSLLKNFSSINPGIVIRIGNNLRTMSINKAVFAEAEVAETFSKEFGIYDLGKVLGVLSLHTQPELELGEHYLAVKDAGGRSSTKIRYTDQKLIVAPPNKSIGVKDFEVSFKLTKEDLNWIEKIGAVLKCPYFVVENQGGKVVILAADVKGEIVDEASITIGESNTTEAYKFVFKVDNLKLLEGSYNVAIAAKGIARFSNDSGVKLTYYVTAENSHSHYGNAEG